MMCPRVVGIVLWVSALSSTAFAQRALVSHLPSGSSGGNEVAVGLDESLWVAGDEASDGVVYKFTPDGRELLATTRLGGRADDRTVDVEVLPDGRVAVVGHTMDSSEFPVFDGAFRSAATNWATYVAVLDPEEGTPLYAATLGGTGYTIPCDLAIGPAGDLYVAGVTSARDFPTTEKAWSTNLRGVNDAFVVRLRPDAGLPPEEQLVFSTFFGGSGNDGHNLQNIYFLMLGMGLHVSADEIATIVGYTTSADLPVTDGALQPAIGGGARDVYVARIDTSDHAVERIVACTYLGGEGAEIANFVDVGPSGNITVVGSTTSGGSFPVPDVEGAVGNAYVAELTPELTEIVRGVHIGSLNWDRPWTARMLGDGRVVLGGRVWGDEAYWEIEGSVDSVSGASSAFLAVYQPVPSGYELGYRTVISGSCEEAVWGLAEGSDGRIIATGWTCSGDIEAGFPDDFANPGASGGFLASLDVRAPSGEIVVRNEELISGSPLSFEARVDPRHEGTEVVDVRWRVDHMLRGSGEIFEHTFDAPGAHIVELLVVNDIGNVGYAKRSLLVGPPTGNLGPWAAADLSPGAIPGGASVDAEGCVTLWAGHHLAYQSGGDRELSLRARVQEIDPSRSIVRGGLGWYESLASDSRRVELEVQRSRSAIRLRLRYRAEEGTISEVISLPRDAAEFEIPDLWIRLDRVEDTFVGYASADGQSWLSVGAAVIPESGAGGDEPGPSIGLWGVDSTSILSDVQGMSRYLFCDVEFGAPELPSPFIRGDVDGSGALELTDAVRTLGELFLGLEPSACRDASDTNDDGDVDLSDAVAVLGYLFLGEDAPPAPYPDCGLDPTGDGLDCERSTSCP